MTKGRFRRAQEQAERAEQYSTNSRQSRRIRPARHEPGTVGSPLEENPEQPMLPGFPRGLLAYQRNSRYGRTAAGGAERARSDKDSAEGSPSPPTIP